jgi:MSHA pilin protein MshB
MNRKGFTLIELILVIAILGILAVSALPKFLNLSENAAQAARDGVVGAVRSGIALYKANAMVNSPDGVGAYPAGLGTGFSAVLETPVTDGWTGSTTSYTYNKSGVNSTFTYYPGNGAFQ